MKIVLLMDVHFGVKNDAKFMLKYQKKFFDDIMFPYMKKHNITTMFQAGDIFDRRKYINFETLEECKSFYFNELKKNDILCYQMLGNHDVVFKNTNRINSPTLLLKEYDNIKILDEPIELGFDGVSILVVPWVNSENYQVCLEAIKNSKSEYCLGHFEILGAEIYQGHKSDGGLTPDLFEHFNEVWSGHFHNKSSLSNIRYLGTPFETTWSDHGDQKGFYVFDTETKSLEHIQNPYTIHEKIFYNDTSPEFLDYLKHVDYSTFSGKIIRLFVEKKTNPQLFENFVEQVYKIPTIEFTIMEDVSEFQNSTVETIDLTSSTKKFIEEYIDGVDTAMDKPKIKSIMSKIYMQALMGID